MCGWCRRADENPMFRDQYLEAMSRSATTMSIVTPDGLGGRAGDDGEHALFGVGESTYAICVFIIRAGRRAPSPRTPDFRLMC